MASFFRQFNAIGPIFCSFVQHHQLELRTSKTYSKHQNLVQNKKIDAQNLENIGSPLWWFHSVFWRYATFFEVFWIPPKGLPFVFFDILQHNGCQKIPKVNPPFTILSPRYSADFCCSRLVKFCRNFWCQLLLLFPTKKTTFLTICWFWTLWILIPTKRYKNYKKCIKRSFFCNFETLSNKLQHFL